MKKVMYKRDQLSGSYGIENLSVGTVISFAGRYAPLGYLMCHGQAISRTEYADLFAVIGTDFGEGDGSTTFNVPDIRECVPVGVGQNGTHNIATHDVYGLGEFKDDQVQTHSHTINHQHGTGSTANNRVLAEGTGQGFQIGGQYSVSASSRDVTIPAYSGSSGNNNGRSGTTTHGKRIGLNYIIKYAKAVIPAQPTQEPIIDDNNVSYTSTFSSAKINSQNSYSTSEVDTGKTWIDGKKIYRRVITDTAPSASTEGTSVTKYVVLSSNIDVVTKFECILNGADFYASAPVTPSGAFKSGLTPYYETSGHRIVLRNSAISYNNRPLTVTIEYTKS